jgi:hypothetical protein
MDVSVFVASGDSGGFLGSTPADYPTGSPEVVSVGGTT